MILAQIQTEKKGTLKIANRLKKEFKENGNIIPESWLPYIDIIELALKIAKMFTGVKGDRKIDLILIAIKSIKEALSIK